MAAPILTTKLYIPPPRPNIVRRPHLLERLNDGLHRKLTLVSAPAGFGKTTLVSEWIAACDRPSAWLSLEERDSELTRFLTYVVTALRTLAPRTLAPDIGQGVLDLLQSSQSPPLEPALTVLLNEITTVPHPFILVLDDYHLIDAKPVDDALTFLLRHQPPHVHLVIATREDPQLPLARLRARGQLSELRAADLRFTPAEAAEFLNQVMGLGLSAQDVNSLETRTEGWIAGLQLAALTMRERDDVHGFIRSFAGDNRYIVDYLVEEVLQRQPKHVRSFLLQTSILDRLSGPLCDALHPVGKPCFDATDSSSYEERSSVLLETLERGNLFVVPLDDRRHWYRYHHLFAGVLQARLLEEQPDRLPALHRRASEWYEQNGLTADAIRHALAAEDIERAADLIELAWAEMERSRQAATWLGWAQTLPDKLVRARPVLSVGYAWAHLDAGRLEAAEERLRDAERWLDTSAGMDGRPETPAAAMVVVDKEEFRALPATIASARTYHALALNDVTRAVTYARRALHLLPEEDHLRRGIAGSLLGLATWTGEDLEAAYRSFADAMADFESAGNVLFAITGTYILADIKMAQGRLRQAVRIYERALQLATDQGGSVSVPRGTAELHLGLSELLREQGQVQAARQHLQKSQELGEQASLPRWKYHWCLVQARIRQAQGDLEGTLQLLGEAERWYIRGPVPDIRPIPALKARVWIAQGRLAEALDWAREQGLSAAGDLSYLREFKHVTLARLLIARYKSERLEDTFQEAMALLERLSRAAKQGGRTGSLLEILLLQALAHHAKGDIPGAIVPLQRALKLAQPQGYVRTFVDEGPPLAELLARIKDGGPKIKKYIHKLLAAFAEQKDGHPPALTPQPLVEPLSTRELQVLKLIAQGLTNREIGERLFLALSTVKGHNRNIYGKLQVKNRTEAVMRARELGLL